MKPRVVRRLLCSSSFGSPRVKVEGRIGRTGSTAATAVVEAATMRSSMLPPLTSPASAAEDACIVVRVLALALEAEGGEVDKMERKAVLIRSGATGAC